MSERSVGTVPSRRSIEVSATKSRPPEIQVKAAIEAEGRPGGNPCGKERLET